MLHPSVTEIDTTIAGMPAEHSVGKVVIIGERTRLQRHIEAGNGYSNHDHPAEDQFFMNIHDITLFLWLPAPAKRSHRTINGNDSCGNGVPVSGRGNRSRYHRFNLKMNIDAASATADIPIIR